jgi:hypothetical protein
MRFLLLLVSLVTLIFVSPFIGSADIRTRAGVPEIVMGLLFLSMVLAAARSASRGRASRVVAWCLGVLVILIWVLDLLTGPNIIGIARHVLDVVFLGYVMALILGFLFTPERVTANTIAASLCIYLLLAVLWAEVYSIMELVDSGSFHIAGFENADEPMELGGRATALTLYYSFVTLTTLGYGDITPRTPPARMFAAMEAVTGQIYLTVLVARLVGMHIAHSHGRRTD